MRSTAREPFLQVNTSRGNPIPTRYGQIVPVARVVKLRWPGGGLNWNRPAAVEVQQGQSSRRVPINDATSRTIFTIVLTGLAVALGMSTFLKRRRRHKHDR
ncbi:MAG: hypothetical protein E6I32_11255 [Chloroflexi bacterium]|nr:MAG: hypothetical protein E6I32_11255 [Chloroflexota bacterium]